jgi:hypothetical protein
VTAPIDTGTGGTDLTPQQLGELKLTVQPGSLFDANGNPVANPQVGISPVPASLVMDMLPPGLMQHTFDITIQAPGGSVFTQPATLTMPNVFGAAPGTKLDILSFDHTTGRLVIDGTGTVSADGQTVTSDPGSGVTAPGWHGMTPPGGCGGSGGPPPQPIPPDPSEQVIISPPLSLGLITGDAAGQVLYSQTFNAPPANPNAPPLPPIPGCNVPQHNPSNNQQPFKNVTIQIDGPLAQFAKQTGDLALVSQSFTLSPGSAPHTFSFNAQSYADMFGVGGFKNLTRDQLYGSTITITVIDQLANGDRVRTVKTYDLDRWVDVVDANQANKLAGNTAAFFRTDTSVNASTARKKMSICFYQPRRKPRSVGLLISPFDLSGEYSGNTTAVWKFDPYLSGDRSNNFDITVDNPQGSVDVGTITAEGTATNPTTISVDESGFETALENFLGALQYAYDANNVQQLVYDIGGGVTNPTGMKPIISNSAKVAIASQNFKNEFVGFLPGTITLPLNWTPKRAAKPLTCSLRFPPTSRGCLTSLWWRTTHQPMSRRVGLQL